MNKPYCAICNEEKSHAYIIYRQAKGSISMEHCDACQYLGVDKGDM